MKRELTFETSFEQDTDDFSQGFEEDSDDMEEEFGFKNKKTKRCPVCQQKGCRGTCVDFS